MKKMKREVVFILCCGLLVLGLFQNCGTNFGDPGLFKDVNIVFDKFSTELNEAPPAVEEAVPPSVEVPVFSAHGCLRSLDFMKFDPRWARKRNNGNYAINWDALLELPKREVFDVVPVDKVIELEPNGTPLVLAELPRGHYIYIRVSFWRFGCEKELKKYHFSVTNSHGTFFNGPDYFPDDGQKRSATSFFIRDEFMIDDRVVGIKIGIQEVVNTLLAIDRNYKLARGIYVNDLITLIRYSDDGLTPEED